MNRKAVKWLYQELPDLVGKGVLEQSSADSLRRHYGEIKDSDRKWFVIILCGALGALLIGLGIILLLAHNWEEFSRPLRAVLSFLPLLLAQALAFWVLLKRPASHALKESTSIFLSLMVGSSMALISQTYNIPGDTADFILSWALLTVPLVYLMDAAMPAVIYTALIAFWAGQLWDNPLKAFVFWPLLAVIVPHFIRSLRQEKYAIRSTILAFVMAISVCAGAGFSLGKSWTGSWIIIYSSLSALFYFLGAWKFKTASGNWQKPFHFLGGLGAFIMMYTLTFRMPWESVTDTHHYIGEKIAFWNSLPDNILTFLLIAVVLLMFFKFIRRKDLSRSLFSALPLMAMTGFAFCGYSWGVSMMMFNVYLFIVSVTRVAIGIRNNKLSTINTGMFMLAALILTRFFDSGIGFVFKGVAFIFIGTGFLLTNLIILRRKGGQTCVKN